MRKVLLVHISPSGCCNTLVTILNNGDFGFPYCATPAFSIPAVWCRVFQSRVFSRPQIPVISPNLVAFKAHYVKCLKIDQYFLR